MNTILLQPTDVLFFRDGRPMSGSLAGHTMAWPLPDVTNHALHAALHRAELEGLHRHRPARSGQIFSEDREQHGRIFGSLVTAGPFPVDAAGRWFFPRPLDALEAGSLKVTLRPVCSMGRERDDDPWLRSSLPAPLEFAIGNTAAPSKEKKAEPWLSKDGFEAYLAAGNSAGEEHFLTDSRIADQESSIGIAIDFETQTTGKGEAAARIYTAHYLRLREGFRLGMLAEAYEKEFNNPNARRDLVQALLNGSPAQIVVGGQQRLCTAIREKIPGNGLPLPHGLANEGEFALLPNGKAAVKWVLLSPAIYPEIAGTKRNGDPQNPHAGGWLPNWIHPEDGQVLLTSGPGKSKAARTKTDAGSGIEARLVAALVPKPLVVTGWGLPNDADRPEGGAKSAHLAVPAGAVYYFEADSSTQAAKLAAALNWHGAGDFSRICNRRSTLLGEKGYGLGVCGTWKFYE